MDIVGLAGRCDGVGYTRAGADAAWSLERLTVPELPWTFEYFDDAPAGSGSTTATDMAVFMISHLQNGRYGDAGILDEVTAKEMQETQFRHHPRLDGMAIVFSNAGVTLANVSPSLVAVLTLPLIITVGAAGVLIYAALAWKRRYWGLFGRLYYSLVALSMLIFVAQLGYYNLLGFRF